MPIDKEMLFNEYKLLREEMMYMTSIQNTLLTFTITSSAAILGFAFVNHYLFSLLPFAVIIPMITRILSYRRGLARLAAYLIVFIEPHILEINWETNNSRFFRQRPKNSKKITEITSRLVRLRHYECVFISFASMAFFYWRFFEGITCFRFIHVPIFIIPIPLVVFVFYISKMCTLFDNNRDAWIKEWERYRAESICMNEQIEFD